MTERTYRPFGKTLSVDDDGKPLAVSCKECGRFALDTRTSLCARCSFRLHIKDLEVSVIAANRLTLVGDE